VLTFEHFAEEPTESMITEIRSLIASIRYCAKTVQFDISHSVSVLSRHLARPCTKVIEAAKRIFSWSFGNAGFCCQVCVLLLQDLLQSCSRGGRRRVEDMCYERR
jgi:hypothetical protein